MVIIAIAIQCTVQTALLYILTQWLKKSQLLDLVELKNYSIKR